MSDRRKMYQDEAAEVRHLRRVVADLLVYARLYVEPDDDAEYYAKESQKRHRLIKRAERAVSTERR